MSTQTSSAPRLEQRGQNVAVACASRSFRLGRLCASVLVWIAVPLLLGCIVISIVFDGMGYFPVDVGDEPAETFVQVPMALHQLAHGDILKINLFNNFGTPVLGEPVVYPFALHAWTYALLQPIVAMTVNKFFLAVLTVIVLTAFFTRYFPPLISSICAFLTFSAPSFFYFFQNHPHQGALLYFGFVLIAWRRFFDKACFVRGMLLYAAFLVFFLSVGINGTLFGVGFMILYAAVLGRGQWKLFADGLALWFAAFIAVHPHFIEFFRLAAESARKDYNYQEITAVVPLQFFKDLLVYESDPADPAYIFYSWPVAALIVAGLGMVFFRCWKMRQPGDISGSADRRRSFELPLLCCLLGLLPLAVIVLFRIKPALPAAIPLVKSVNISRVVWFSDVFLVLAAGLAASFVFEKMKFWFLRVVWLGILIAMCAPRFFSFIAQSRHAAIQPEYARFQPHAFIECMKPQTRVATFMDPVPMSYDSKANSEGILGSAGRSIILNKAFKDGLQQRGLTHDGFHGMTYFFVPVPPEALAPYGIRYCITPGPLQQPGRLDWKLVLHTNVSNLGIPYYVEDGVAQSLESSACLYESPFPATPVYIVRSGSSNAQFVEDYRIDGNSVEITLPQKRVSYDLVATWLLRPGWKAFIDGKRTAVSMSQDRFIQVHVDHGKKLLLKYEPYSNGYLIGGCFVSLGAALLISRRYAAKPPLSSAKVRPASRLKIRRGKVAA